MKGHAALRAIASAAVFTAALVFHAVPATGAERQVHRFGEVALSPDGTRVVAIESTDPEIDGERAASSLVIRKTDGSAPVTVALPCAPDPECTPYAPTWAPDGTLLFLLHPPKSSHRAIYRANADGGNAKLVLDFDGTLVSPRFSATGELAVLATPGAHKEIGATQPGAPIVGVIGAAPDEQRIAIVARNGGVTYASPPDLFVYEYDWNPQGGFVGTAAHGDGDDNWWIARLYAFENGAAREIYKPESPQLQIASPRVMPGGHFVAFIGGLMSDFGSTGGDLYLVPLDSREAVAATDVTAGLAATVTSILPSCPGSEAAPRLDVTILRGGSQALDVWQPGATELRDAMTFSSNPANPESASSITHSCGAAPSIAYVAQTFGQAPEIRLVHDIGSLPTVGVRLLTHENDGIAPATRARLVTWKTDAGVVTGYLLAPAKPDTGTHRHPLILEVHGGPAAATTPRFVGRGTERDLLRAGYYLFLPNPRGSFGNGETFVRANVRDFGYGDLRDDLAGIDAVEKIAPIDDTRLGITGGSYGGFMSMWAVTQTHRFKAAVASAGIANWISYYGENGIDQWMIPYFGASAYDDPAVYRKSSPIDFIKNVTTPTLVLVGERDVECPPPQSEEFWHALETLGVPTQLVIYPGEGHGMRQPKDRADVTQRSMAWFARYLGASP